MFKFSFDVRDVLILKKNDNDIERYAFDESYLFAFIGKFKKSKMRKLDQQVSI